MQPRRPFVLVNMAMTADGKIATANRRVVHFGSAADQRNLHALRATADAVLCGARTAGEPGTTMGPGPARFRALRQRRGLAEYNLRVIVSGSGSINPQATVFQKRFSPILILTTRHAGTRRLGQMQQVAEAVKVCGDKNVNFKTALRWLYEKWGVRRLVVEGGGELNSALFAAGLVDELHLTVCPYVFGGRTAPTIAEGEGADTLAHARRFQLISARRRGGELFLVYRAQQFARLAPIGGANLHHRVSPGMTSGSKVRKPKTPADKKASPAPARP